MDPVTGTIVGSGLSAGGGIFSTLLQNKAQKKAQSRAFGHNKEMWNLANQYNTPEMQMKRLRDAGLNPNLVYGSGSVVGNTSTSTPTYDAPNLQRLPLEMLNPMDVLGQFIDLRQKSAMADKAESEAQWIDADKSSKIVSQAINAQQLTRMFGAKWKQYLLKGKQKVDVNLEGGPFMERYQAESKGVMQRNQLNQIMLQFHDAIPKKWQFIAPLLLNFLKLGK